MKVKQSATLSKTCSRRRFVQGVATVGAFAFWPLKSPQATNIHGLRYALTRSAPVRT